MRRSKRGGRRGLTRNTVHKNQERNAGLKRATDLHLETGLLEKSRRRKTGLDHQSFDLPMTRSKTKCRNE